MNTKIPLLIISGPTAAGKTSLSIKLAQHFNAEIINIDSVQMFSECNIGSAKPTLEEQEGIKHHLFDICLPSSKNNAAFFLEQAEAAIQDIRSKGKNVIACGGTMLYLKALLYDLAELPKSDAQLRDKIEQKTTEELYSELSQHDPESAKRLHANDRTRIVRSLEVFYLTGNKASEMQKKHAFQTPKENALIFIPTYPRAELYQRINERTKIMLDSGLIDETKKIITLYGEDAPVLETVGYKETKDYLAGIIPGTTELYEAICQSTRQLAKRQMVFWRNEPYKRGWEILNQDQLELVETPAPQAKKSLQKDFLAPKLSPSDIISIINRESSQELQNIKLCYFA